MAACSCNSQPYVTLSEGPDVPDLPRHLVEDWRLVLASFLRTWAALWCCLGRRLLG